MTDSIGERLAAQQQASRKQLARYDEIRSTLAALRVTGTSTDRTVTVEMAAGGAIVGIGLSDLAMAKTPETLSATILEAIRSGSHQIAERTADEVEALTGRRVDVAPVLSGQLPDLNGSTSAKPRIDERYQVEE